MYSTESIGKGRFILLSVMPFILLSLVLPAALRLFGLLNGYTVFLCLINAVGSCIDSLNVYLVATQVPNGAHLTNNGFETYFK